MVKKRLLVLTPRFPYPAIGGDRLRILHLCRALSSRFELTLLSLCETRTEMELRIHDGLFSNIERVYLPRWRSYLNAALAIPTSRPLQLAYYESDRFRSRVNALVPEHDLVLAHLVRTGQYLEHSPRPKLLEMTDAISMSYLRNQMLAERYGWKKLIQDIEQNRLMTYERRTVKAFDRVWLTSRVDRDFLDPLHQSPIDVIPNGTDLNLLSFQPPAPDASVIVFIANMASLQNQDACHYFLRRILPKVRAHANLTFRIVGNAPPRVRKRFQKYAGVQMTGLIDHIQDGVEGAFCGVCPIRGGAGIQNKILEYLAMGLPCVTSMAGLNGVEARPGRELMAYRDPDEAARQILMLHANPALRLKMAAAGYELVRGTYNWQLAYKAFVNSSMQLDFARQPSRQFSLQTVNKLASHRGRKAAQIYSDGLRGVAE